MTFGSAARFALAASVAAAIGALALTPWFLGDDRLTADWAARGFLAMALPGIVCGAWLAQEHGRNSSRFVMALGTGFILRLVLGALAAAGAAKAGRSAIVGLLPGLAAGFVSVTAFEMLWFVRAARLARIPNETRA